MKFAYISIALCFLAIGCVVTPDNLEISVNDSFADAQTKLKYIKSKLSGEGIVDEEYFVGTDDKHKACWYLLPNNTLLGLNLKNSGEEIADQRNVKQILIGEIGTGFTDKIRWDMQVKTHLQKIDLENHRKKYEKSQSINLEVGQVYDSVLDDAKQHGCFESEIVYEYKKTDNVKYDWLVMPDNTTVQLCGYYDEKQDEKVHYLVELLVCNSRTLFDYRSESWYSAQSLHLTKLGKKIWGIDVQASYFNVYKGMHSTDALKTLKVAGCEIIKEKIDLKDVKFLSNHIEQSDFSQDNFQRYKLNDDTDLLISSKHPVENADEKISEIFIYTKVPDLESLQTVYYLIEFEFVDLVMPLMEDWHKHLN